MRRREFIRLVAVATAAWPLAARAQQTERMRRIGVLVSAVEGDPRGLEYVTAFAQGLAELGWTVGRNVRIEYRWGAGDLDRFRRYAAELVALSPDVVLAASGAIVGALQQASRTVPIVFVVDDAIIAVEMMVRKMEEGYDKVRAATFAYDVTAMPMLTGTLITAAGFLPIGMAKSTVGEYTFAIFAVTVIALVLCWFVSVYFVPYLGTLLLQGQAARPATAPPHELFDTPFYSALPPHGGLVRGAPLDHHRRDAAHLRAGHRRHGQGAAAVLPRFEPARDHGRHLVPRRHVVRGQRRGDQARRAAPA